MSEKILILDFGSQYTQLIARRLRELNVYCEILPYHSPTNSIDLHGVKGLILSGSPASVRQEKPLIPDLNWLNMGLPILGICYGAQWLAHTHGGIVAASKHREYGRARVEVLDNNALFAQIQSGSTVWMSHGDSIQVLPSEFFLTAKTTDIPVAAFQHTSKPWFGLQFHPEVVHSQDGLLLLRNFAFQICGCSGDWTEGHFIEEITEKIRSQVGADHVILALSGGVDSTVAAILLNKAIGDQLHCIFVDNGLLRKGEAEQVMSTYSELGLSVSCAKAGPLFFDALSGKTEPEAKRKAIGEMFIRVFESEAKAIPYPIHWLAQGTIYPDVIESVSVTGPSVTIKSHHNVGGLPAAMKMGLVEPLRSLFKDEVRRVGKSLGIPHAFINRHPFPGPGLAIRCLGAISPENIAMLQEADAIYIQALREANLYDSIWQAAAILLPVQSVGVMGDERTYEKVVALRAVTSTDGMTADVFEFPEGFLREVANRIINQVRGINRVVYDVSSKPPATIEWE
ncbi:MAG: glutamine-hydrolyzing GMP synthase [Bacteroidetes bacterium]|nr:glutamine-hydrolyzing GMP synthase [Bacteroidota bacterium]